MKKFYLTLLIVFFTGTLTAQTGGNVNGWYDPTDFIKNNATGPFTDTVEIVFPDSNVVFINKNKQAKRIYSHAWGHLFDLRHDNWAAVPSNPSFPIQIFDQSDNYTWDSLAFNYIYMRNNSDTTVIDTCFVTYYKNTDLDQINNGLAIYNNGDTMLYARPRGFDSTTLAGEYFFKRDTLLLTAADTTEILSNGWVSRYKVLPVGEFIYGTTLPSLITRPPSWFGASVTFKPGHRWNIDDTVEAKGGTNPLNGINYFGFTYTTIKEANGGLPVTLRSRRFADNSLLLTSNPKLPNYNGFSPANTFASPMFANVQAFVSGVIGNVNELGVSLGKLYPNPVTNNKTVFINYKLRKTAIISIDVYDIMGKKVGSVLDPTKIEAGEHTSETTLNLKTGTYYYSLRVEGVIAAAQKFVVVR